MSMNHLNTTFAWLLCCTVLGNLSANTTSAIFLSVSKGNWRKPNVTIWTNTPNKSFHRGSISNGVLIPQRKTKQRRRSLVRAWNVAYTRQRIVAKFACCIVFPYHFRSKVVRACAWNSCSSHEPRLDPIRATLRPGKSPASPITNNLSKEQLFYGP